MAFSKIAAENLGGSTLPALSGTNLTSISAGKVLQVVRSALSSTAYSTSSTMATTGMTASITPSSSSNYLFAIVTCHYQLYTATGNGTATEPFGGFRLRVTPSGGSADTKSDITVRHINFDTSNNDEMRSATILTGYWSPSSAVAQSLDLHFSADNGRLGIYGTDQNTNGSAITVMEIAG